MFPAVEGRDQSKGLKATGMEDPDLGPGDGDWSILESVSLDHSVSSFFFFF